MPIAAAPQQAEIVVQLGRRRWCWGFTLLTTDRRPQLWLVSLKGGAAVTCIAMKRELRLELSVEESGVGH